MPSGFDDDLNPMALEFQMSNNTGYVNNGWNPGDLQNHRRVEVGVHLWRSLSASPLLKQGQLQQVAQDCFQMGFVLSSRLIFLNFSGQPLPGKINTDLIIIKTFNFKYRQTYAFLSVYLYANAYVKILEYDLFLRLRSIYYSWVIVLNTNMGLDSASSVGSNGASIYS